MGLYFIKPSLMSLVLSILLINTFFIPKRYESASNFVFQPYSYYINLISDKMLKKIIKVIFFT